MDRDARIAESEEASLALTAASDDVGRQHRRYSALQTQDHTDEPADDRGHVQAFDSPAEPPSYHLLDPGQDNSTKKGLGEPTYETLTREDGTGSYNQHHNDDGGRQLPPRTLTPLTNGQIALLVLELLAVLAMTIAGIKGLVMLPNLDLFSVPPMTQDCGGYSVPAVERSFYINLQIARNLSFTRAKLLDLAWDTVVGQGGRFLHAWVLYQVAASQLSWMMEYSSVPYYFQLDILFSTASLPALWSTLRFLGTRRPARAVFSAVWFLLAILYVLAFSSVWGAATGYLNPSKPAYMMSDSSYVTVDSKSLSLCMSVDTERLNGTVPAVVQGPRLGDCFDSFESLGGSPTCNVTDGSEDWMNIIACKSRLPMYPSLGLELTIADLKTKRTIQSFYSNANYTSVVNDTTDFNLWGYNYAYSRGSDILGARMYSGQHREQYGYTGYTTTSSSYSAVPGLYRQFTGFQFAGAGQEVTNMEMPWFNTTFQLDPSVNVSSWGEPFYSLDTVPYNSTLWWKGSAIPLEAPFLSLPAREDDCRWVGFSRLCVCYRDALLTSDFQEPKNLICISEEGYVWGFSSVITLIGIILEVCWIVGCFGMWIDVHINSNLFRMNRRGSGVVRNILDLGGAIRTDLGCDTGAYRNGALLKELEKLPPVGYEVVDEGQQGRISIVPMPRARRRGPGLKAGKLYA
jgi:hypothetical protein